jgi:hypothetical protein
MSSAREDVDEPGEALVEVVASGDQLGVLSHHWYECRSDSHRAHGAKGDDGIRVEPVTSGTSIPIRSM